MHLWVFAEARRPVLCHQDVFQVCLSKTTLDICCMVYIIQVGLQAVLKPSKDDLCWLPCRSYQQEVSMRVPLK